MEEKNHLNEEELKFLEQSNYIEGVRDDDSLQQAVYAWEFLKSQKDLTIQVVLKTHKILMLNQKIEPDQKGYFRKKEVGIYKNEIAGIMGDNFIMQKIKIRDVLSWKKIKGGMETWIYLVSRQSSFEYPKEFIKQCHIQYETIHPFIDGNGRTGRMFMNWQRLKAKLPIVIILEEEKKEYYKWFPK